MEVKDAIATAKGHVATLFADEEITEVRLEEVRCCLSNGPNGPSMRSPSYAAPSVGMPNAASKSNR